jgi:hypothetical protein
LEEWQEVGLGLGRRKQDCKERGKGRRERK